MLNRRNFIKAISAALAMPTALLKAKASVKPPVVTIKNLSIVESTALGCHTISIKKVGDKLEYFLDGESCGIGSKRYFSFEIGEKRSEVFDVQLMDGGCCMIYGRPEGGGSQKAVS